MADYSTLRVRPATAENARRLSRNLGMQADQNIPVIDAVAAAVAYALRHVDDPQLIEAARQQKA